MSLSAILKIDPPSLPAGFLSNQDGPIAWPGTEHVHAALVHSAIDRERNVCLLTPTLAHEHLDILAIEALFSLMGRERKSVFVMSGDTSIRERFLDLRPKGAAPYSIHRWPVANVSHDGGLTMKSRNWKNADQFPGFIFRRTSTQLPNPDIARKIGGVIYDDTVKYTDERWNDFLTWADDCDIPSIVFCIRDPMSDLVKQLPEATKWTWPPRHLGVVRDTHDLVDKKENFVATPQTERVNSLLDQKLDGIDYRVHVCQGEGSERLDEMWGEIREFDDLASEIGTPELEGAAVRLKSSLGVLSRMLSELEVTDDYYMRHPKHISLLSRLDGLTGYADRLASEAKSAVATGEYRQLIDQFEELYEDWPTLDVNSRKQGALLSFLHSTADDEETTHVLVPDETSVQALKADLELNHPRFFDRISPLLEVSSARGLPMANKADNLVLYGPLKFDQRWIYRSPHGKQVTLLAYPHELGLLVTQIKHANDVLREWSDHPNSGEVLSIDGCDPSRSDVESVDIDVPDPTEWADDRVADYEFGSGRVTSVDDIVDGYSDKFEWKKSRAAGDLALTDEERRSGGRRTRQRELVADCYDIHFNDGEAMYVGPQEKLHVLDGDMEAVKKPVRAVKPGDVVITLKNRDVIREQVRELLLDRGNIDLIYHAEMWKNELQRAIDRNEDDLEDFIERCRSAGIDRKKSTLEAWYNDEVNYTRYKSDMRMLAEAYELEDVINNFESVWEATQLVKTIGTKLMRELRKRAYMSGLEEEVTLSDDYDIRLSDFSVTDESGDELVKAHEVTTVDEGVDVPRYQLGHRRKV